MNCQECLALLDRPPTRPPTGRARHEMERHLSHCPACRADQRFLPRLRRETAELPRALRPSRDLWEGIAARLDRPDHPARPVRPLWSRPPALAAAALLLLTISAAATALLLRDHRPPALQTAQVRRMEQAYQAAASDLTGALESNRAALGPQAAASVERSLRELDTAIVEARRALEQHPGSLELAGFLRDSYQKKIDLLQRTAQAREGS